MLAEPKIIKTRPESLISPFRFDLMAKYLYAKYKLDGIESSWAENLLFQLLRVLNGFKEKSGSRLGFKGFTESFEKILQDINENGFDDNFPIPVSKTGSALDGTDRLAACLAAGKEISCYIEEESNKGLFNCTSFFLAAKKDIFPTGLSQHCLDAMAITYMQLKKCTLICYCSDQANFQNLPNSTVGQIVYDKIIRLSEHGRRYLSDFLLEGKLQAREYVCVRLCHHSENEVKLDLENTFISSGEKETTSLAEFFFDNQTLNYFNENDYSFMNHFSSEIRKLKRQIKRIGMEHKSIALPFPSSQESLLPLIFHKEIPEGFDSWNSFLQEQEVKIDELIFNPDKSFNFQGMKILTPEQTEFVSRNREIKKKSDRELILITNAGLCNRLRTICLYQVIADYTGRTFKLYWVKERKEHNILFEDLFENKDILIEAEDLEERSHSPDSFFIEINYGASVSTEHWERGGRDPAYYQDSFKADLLDTVERKCLIVKTICKFIPSFIDQATFDRDFRNKLNDLRLKAEIKQKVDDFCEENFPKEGRIIGVHVRRTDRTDSIEASTDEKFITAMKEIQSEDPEVMFFLATDEVDVNKKFKEIFGSSLILFEKAYDQKRWERPSTIEEGVIDLMLLSKTDRILGSLNSSFSQMAALFHNIPFKEIK